MPQIRVLLGYQQGHVFSLADRGLVIGRDPVAGIVLHPDSAASRRHAEIFHVDGQWRLRDLGSVNGTALNGRRVHEEPLRDKDEVLIGDNVFVYEEVTSDAAEIAEAASRVNAAETGGYHNRPETQALIHSLPARVARLRSAVAEDRGGTAGILTDMLAALIAGGHLFVDGPSGSAAAQMVDVLAAALDLKCKAISLTSKSAPADLVAEIASCKSGDSISRQVFTVKDLGRLPPQMRAILLEAIERSEVTIDGIELPFEPPFLLVATQNADDRGTSHPLNEAELDRFMCSVRFDGPARADAAVSSNAIAAESTLSVKQILALQRAVRDLPVSDHVVQYAVSFVRSSRPTDEQAAAFVKKHVYAGPGPRAAQHLVLGAKAIAVLGGRLIVTAADVRSAARGVLRHRIFANFSAALSGVDRDRIITQLVEETPEPCEADD